VDERAKNKETQNTSSFFPEKLNIFHKFMETYFMMFFVTQKNIHYVVILANL